MKNQSRTESESDLDVETMRNLIRQCASFVDQTIDQMLRRGFMVRESAYSLQNELNSAVEKMDLKFFNDECDKA